jgi:predicted ribosomally synthesized peptide with nif11-like leader
MQGRQLPFQAMSQEQLSALLAKLQEDAGLREKLQGAGDLDAAVAMAKEAGFDVCRKDWFDYQSESVNAITDQDLELVAGGADKYSIDSQCMVPPSCGGKRCG